MLVVDLVVTGVNDLFAASFTATYDPAIATYAGHSLGNSVLLRCMTSFSDRCRYSMMS